jgi:hypothetical protein
MYSNVVFPSSQNVVFKRIGFVIQKGLAAQLVARLPSIKVCITSIYNIYNTIKINYISICV